MTKKVSSLIRHICLIWLIIYLIISIFKFIQINIRINEKYGLVSKKFFVVGYTNESIVIDNILLLLDRTVFPHFNPFYRYTVPEKMSTNIVFKTSFMDGKFSVTMKDGIITRDNFYEVLCYDNKFQHMYSEWVKKQVGIDDKNVELEFSKSADVRIDFDKIDQLSKDCKEIFENTHNLYLNNVIINNFNLANVDDILTMVNGYEPLLKPYIFTDVDNELRFEIELEDLQNEQNDLYLCSIIFDYNKNDVEKSSEEIVGLYIYNEINSKNSIKAIYKKEQLNQINNHYNINMIKELSSIVIPDYYVNCEVNHWLLPEDVVDEEELIKTPEGKYFQDYIIRIDKSDMLKNEYVVDILYCDLADDIISYDYDEKTKKYIPIKTYKTYKNGKRLDMYYNDISSKLLYKGKLRNPMFIRYVISQDNNSFRVIDKTDIYEKDYKGATFKYYYE